MTKQFAPQLALNVPDLDLKRLTVFNPDPHGTRWRVGSGDVRAGQQGTNLGTLSVRHASGYAVVLQLDDGRIETFAPETLFPITTTSED